MCVVLPYQPTIPKLQSLTLYYLDLFFGRERKLFEILEERLDHQIVLESLDVEACRVPKVRVKNILRIWWRMLTGT